MAFIFDRVFAHQLTHQLTHQGLFYKAFLGVILKVFGEQEFSSATTTGLDPTLLSAATHHKRPVSSSSRYFPNAPAAGIRGTNAR